MEEAKGRGPPGMLTVRLKGMAERWGPWDSGRSRKTGENHPQGQRAALAIRAGGARSLHSGGGVPQERACSGCRCWWVLLQYSWQLNLEVGKGKVALMEGEPSITLRCRQGEQEGE